MEANVEPIFILKLIVGILLLAGGLYLFLWSQQTKSDFEKKLGNHYLAFGQRKYPLIEMLNPYERALEGMPHPRKETAITLKQELTATANIIRNQIDQINQQEAANRPVDVTAPKRRLAIIAGLVCWATAIYLGFTSGA